jgi:hypothetical protein
VNADGRRTPGPRSWSAPCGRGCGRASRSRSSAGPPCISRQECPAGAGTPAFSGCRTSIPAAACHCLRARRSRPLSPSPPRPTALSSTGHA